MVLFGLMLFPLVHAAGVPALPAFVISFVLGGAALLGLAVGIGVLGVWFAGRKVRQAVRRISALDAEEAEDAAYGEPFARLEEGVLGMESNDWVDWIRPGVLPGDGKSRGRYFRLLVRWEHVDCEAGTIHRPKPKGGEDRAFTVPLSEEVLGILRRRREQRRAVRHAYQVAIPGYPPAADSL